MQTKGLCCNYRRKIKASTSRSCMVSSNIHKTDYIHEYKTTVLDGNVAFCAICFFKSLAKGQTLRSTRVLQLLWTFLKTSSVTKPLGPARLCLLPTPCYMLHLLCKCGYISAVLF